MSEGKTAARVIERREQVDLVEWVGEDGPGRVWLPTGTVQEGEVDPLELGRGISYGMPWEELVTVTATPERIAAELRRAGLWTAEDVRQRPQAAQGALLAAMGTDLAALLRLARRA